MEPIVLNGSGLTLEELRQVAYDRRPVELDPQALERAAQARQVLFDMAAEGKPVYGLNWGVGWNKDKEFDPEFFETYTDNYFIIGIELFIYFCNLRVKFNCCYFDRLAVNHCRPVFSIAANSGKQI